MKRFAISLVVGAIAATPVWAASDNREKQMLRRMQQQVQQIEQARALAEQEKAAALADKETAEREVEKLGTAQRQLSGERTARGRAERELKTLQAEMEALKLKLSETETKLVDSETLRRTTAQTLTQTESARKQIENQLADRQQDLKICQSHNGQLYGLGREMMHKYRDKSCQDALAQVEPFTGLKKVEMENLLEAYRDKLDDQKLVKAPGG